MSRPARAARAAAIALAALLTAACAGGKLEPDASAAAPPPTGEAASERTGPDTYKVSFAAVGDVTRAERQAGLLLRAAQITLAEGYDHFVIIDRASVYDDEPQPSLGGLGVGVGVFGGSSSGLGVGISLGGGRTDPSFRRPGPVAEVAEIRLARGPADPRDVDAYDARAVLSR